MLDRVVFYTPEYPKRAVDPYNELETAIDQFQFRLPEGLIMLRCCWLFVLALLILAFEKSSPGMAQREIEKLLQSGDGEKQMEGLQKVIALGAGGEEYLDSIIELLKTDDAHVAGEAALAITAIGPGAKKAVPTLIEFMSDANRLSKDGEKVWVLYSKALTAIGPEAVPELLQHIHEQDITRYKGICQSLHDLGPVGLPVLDELIKRAESGSGDERIASIFVLEPLGEKAEPALPMLVGVLENDEDFQTQVFAMRVLAGIGQKARPAIPGLLKLIAEGAASSRGNAAMTLGAVTTEAEDLEKVLPAMIRALHDDNQNVATRAAIGLGRLKAKGQPALDELRAMLKERKFAGKVDACRAIWLITGDTAEAAQLALPLVNNINTEIDALQLLVEMKSSQSSVIETLVKKLESEDESVLELCAKALGAAGKKSAAALPRLKNLADHPDQALKDSVNEAIRQIED